MRLLLLPHQSYKVGEPSVYTTKRTFFLLSFFTIYMIQSAQAYTIGTDWHMGTNMIGVPLILVVKTLFICAAMMVLGTNCNATTGIIDHFGDIHENGTAIIKT